MFKAIVIFATNMALHARTARHLTLTYNWETIEHQLNHELSRKQRLALIEALWNCSRVSDVDWDARVLTVRVMPRQFYHIRCQNSASKGAEKLTTSLGEWVKQSYGFKLGQSPVALPA